MEKEEIDKRIDQAIKKFAAAKMKMRECGYALDGHIHLNEVTESTEYLDKITKIAAFWYDKLEDLKKERRRIENSAGYT